MPRLLAIGRFALCTLAAPLAAQTINGADAELLQRSACGAVLPSGQGLIFGVVRGADLAPRPGLQVAAMWTELVMTRRGSSSLLRASVDTAHADGSYSLCGVPVGTLVAVRATGEDERSGELQLELTDGGVRELDLLVADRAAVASVQGRLLSPAGNPLNGAIDIVGDSIVPVITDAEGQFRLSAVPRRSGQLRIRSVGYEPLLVAVAPDGPVVDLGDVMMPRPVTQLDQVLIAERFMSAERRGFEDRRKVLNGTFLDDEYFERWSIRSANTIRMAGLGIRGWSESSGDVITLRYSSGLLTGNNGCFPLVYLDGVNLGRQGPAPNSRIPGQVQPDQMRYFLQLAKRMEIYQAQFAPAEFADIHGCGTLLIWTR